MKTISICFVMILISFMNPSCEHKNRDSKLDDHFLIEKSDKVRSDGTLEVIDDENKVKTDSIFKTIKSLIIHDNSEYQWERIKEKVAKDYSPITGSFRKEIVLILKLNPQQEIVPIGKIRIGNVEVLFVEIFIMKFPIMFSDVFGLLYSIDSDKILDSIHLYYDIDVGIKDCMGFFFEWDFNEGRIFSRSCDDLEEISVKTVNISDSLFLVADKKTKIIQF